jgi:hypothetical protein
MLVVVQVVRCRHFRHCTVVPTSAAASWGAPVAVGGAGIQ